MKTIKILISILLLLFFVSANSQEVSQVNPTTGQTSVKVSCTPDLNQLTVKWASEYRRVNPGVEVIVVDNKDLDAGLNLSFIDNQSNTAAPSQTNWKLVVGRSVTVPVMNAGNPYLKEIMLQGVSPEKIASLFKNPGNQNWGTLLSEKQNAPLHLYIVNDETVKVTVRNFIQEADLPFSAISFGTKDEVIANVQKDPYAIGFCNFTSILSPVNQSIVENVKLLPIDKNGNGTLDYMEAIYSDANEFQRGVWIGKYPKALYSNIYAVSNAQPTDNDDLAFLSWVLTTGQQYMNTNGYCNLTANESQSQLEKINFASITVSPEGKTSNAGLILLILGVILATGFITSALFRRYRKQANIVPEFNVRPNGFDENSVVVPAGLYFDKAHTWAFMEKDGNLAIGIDDFLQHVTGPISRIEMKNAGEKIKKGELLFSIIQSGKQLNLFAPVSGVIKKQNEALLTNPDLMNTSPYSEGWVYRIEPSKWFYENQLLSMAEKHKKWLVTEFSRVKDFIAAKTSPGSLEYSHVVLQDGGQLKEGILSEFGPEVWDDFQTYFLNPMK